MESQLIKWEATRKLKGKNRGERRGILWRSEWRCNAMENGMDLVRCNVNVIAMERV